MRNTASKSENTAVPSQPGMPANKVQVPDAVNVAAQSNSERRAILKTLQNRKKWPTTKPMIHPAHKPCDPATNAPALPHKRTTASKAEIRKPGLNGRSGMVFGKSDCRPGIYKRVVKRAVEWAPAHWPPRIFGGRTRVGFVWKSNRVTIHSLSGR
jgi:hypothetical protein